MYLMQKQLAFADVEQLKPFSLDHFQDIAAGFAVYTDPARNIHDVDGFLIDHLELEKEEYHRGVNPIEKLGELGDCLWYIAEMATVRGLNLSEIPTAETNDSLVGIAQIAYEFVGQEIENQGLNFAEVASHCINKLVDRGKTKRGLMPGCAPIEVLINDEVQYIRPCGENRLAA